MRIWLKQIRKELRYAPKEIAEKCEITRNYYDLIETGKRNPSVALAQKIANMLEFDWTRFFSTEESDAKIFKITEPVAKECKSESIIQKR